MPLLCVRAREMFCGVVVGCRTTGMVLENPSACIIFVPTCQEI